MEVVTEKQHIERRPGVMGGKPCIAGTRIRVQDIYYWHLVNGQSPEQLAVLQSLSDDRGQLEPLVVFNHMPSVIKPIEANGRG